MVVGLTRVRSINKPSIYTNIFRYEFTARLALAIAACTLGSSFQFGFNTGVINAPAKVLMQFYNDTVYHRSGHYIEQDTLTFLWAVTVAMFAVGGMLGGVSAGYWANSFGRKKTLLFNNILMVVAVTVEVLSRTIKSYEVLIVGRLIIGINAGINTGVAPMYLSEIAPVSLRGFCGTINQLCTTFGILISTVLGLDVVLGNYDYWQLALGFPLVMVFFQMCTLSFCPESPRYLLISKHSEIEAKQALVWFRGSHNMVHDEMAEMISEREALNSVKKFSVGDLIHSKELRAPLIICIMMHLSQQFSGINAVIYYSTSIFELANLSVQNAQYATLATGAVNMCMTFISALLMDRVGRRTLHLAGLGGMFITSYILALGQIYEEYQPQTWVADICVIAVILYIISFASGPGSIPWFFTAELFGQGPRPAAVSIGVLINWTANFIVGLVYPFLQGNFIKRLNFNPLTYHCSIHVWAMLRLTSPRYVEAKIKAFSFIPFVVFLGIFWIYTHFKVPETKGRTIEEITADFRKSSYIPIDCSVNNAT